VSFTVRGRTRIPAGELREAELTWHSLGERGGPLGEPLDGDFHLRVEAKIRAGLRPRSPCPTARRFVLRSTTRTLLERLSWRCSSRAASSKITET
jgi:hypothetical protein